ncbi:MAG: sigma-70 family RNA polymerase sigma factor, partial [Planctomycetota bacterium]
MTDQPSAPSAEQLLSHGGFLQRLAHGLLLDAHLAEDAVQDTWVTALERPPAMVTNLRGWLSVVVKNFSRMTRRTLVRRSRRERLVAAQEGVPSAAEVAARLDVQERVVEAVRSLAEPYRSTVVLRFFDDLSPMEIAERSGIPLPTVHTRLRRALEQLRGRLDDDHHGDRKAWATALLPLALGKKTAIAAGAAAGTATKGLLTAKPLLVSALVLVPGAIVLMLALVQEPGLPPQPIAHVGQDRNQGSEGGAPSADGSSVEGEDSVRTFSGVVVDPDGSPIAGAETDLLFFAYRSPEFEPADRQVTSADGRFRVVQPRRLNNREGLYLRATKSGFVTVYLDLRRSGDEVRLTLQRGEKLEVTVIDPDTDEGLAGAKVAVSLRKRAVSPLSWRSDGVTDEDGAACLVSPLGEVTVFASAKDRPFLSQKVVVREGERNQVRLTLFRGATVRGKVVEKGSGRPLEGIRVKRETKILLTDHEGRFELTGLRTDDGFALQGSGYVWQRPWFRGLPLGQITERVFELDPAGMVSGMVLDDRGKPVRGAYVGVWDNPLGGNRRGYRRDENQLHTITGPEGEFTLSGFPPGKEMALYAVREGRSQGDSKPVSVGAGERIDGVVIRLQPAVTVILELETEDGAPLPWFCTATATVPAEVRQRKFERRASPLDGEIRLWGLPRSGFEIAVEARGYVWVDLDSKDILAEGDGDVHRVPVALSRGLWIGGRVENDVGKPIRGAYVTASQGPFQNGCFSGEDGEFEIGGLW